MTPDLSRILALDLGKRRIGLAISDPLRITAQGLPNLIRTRIRDDLDALEGMVREREVGLILLGNPMNMKGTEGRQSGWDETLPQPDDRIGPTSTHASSASDDARQVVAIRRLHSVM